MRKRENPIYLGGYPCRSSGGNTSPAKGPGLRKCFDPPTMETVHLVAGIVVLVTNLVAGAWGAIAWYRNQPSVSFWYLLRVAQATVVVQVLAGSVLLLLGNEAPDGLHYVYGTLAAGGHAAGRRRALGAAEQRARRPRLRRPAEGAPAPDRDRDRSPRNGDHGGLGAARAVPRAAGGWDQRRPLLRPHVAVGSYIRLFLLAY